MRHPRVLLREAQHPCNEHNVGSHVACVNKLGSIQPAIDSAAADAVHSACLSTSESFWLLAEESDGPCLLQGRTALFQLDSTALYVPVLAKQQQAAYIRSPQAQKPADAGKGP